MMIKKGMNVIDLINSNILFPEIWEEYTLFSEVDSTVMVAYNNYLEDLAFEDPARYVVLQEWVVRKMILWV